MSTRPVPVASTLAGLDRATLPLKVAAVGLGTVLLALAAHITVPFWPVPMTLQTLVVLVIGAVAGPWLAVATVVAYIAEGLAGLPVFTRVGGIDVLLGPTGGYIVGFIAAAALAGLAARRGWLRSLSGAAGSFVLADAVLFAFGVAWLAVGIGWDKALAAGLVPFFAGEALKIALAVAITRLWNKPVIKA